MSDLMNLLNNIRVQIDVLINQAKNIDNNQRVLLDMITYLETRNSANKNNNNYGLNINNR